MCCIAIDRFSGFAIPEVRNWFVLDKRVAEADASLMKNGPKDVETGGQERTTDMRKRKMTERRTNRRERKKKRYAGMMAGPEEDKSRLVCWL